jgi:hypothetical protein
MNGGTLWYSVPATAVHNIYVNETSRCEMNSTGLTVNGNININSSGTNSLVFDKSFNNNKIKLNSTNGIGADDNNFMFYSSGTFTFKNSTLTTTLFSIGSNGAVSFNSIIYPAGGISTGGNITTSGTLTGASIVEGGVAINTKYLSLGGGTLTGVLNVGPGGA